MSSYILIGEKNVFSRARRTRGYSFFRLRRIYSIVCGTGNMRERGEQELSVKPEDKRMIMMMKMGRMRKLSGCDSLTPTWSVGNQTFKNIETRNRKIIIIYIDIYI